MIRVERLLPGDPAPNLKLSCALNRDELPSIVFDRASLVILWNAGCAGCLPVIGELAEATDQYDIPWYGMAVMVRNVEATTEAAKSSPSKVLLAVEARPEDTSGISHGWVTRHWFEARGQQTIVLGRFKRRVFAMLDSTIVRLV